MELFKNLSETTLNGSINNSVTSITVTDGSQLPSSGNFRLFIDNELLLCKARSSNTLTVARGQEGTSASSHSDLAPVRHVFTAGGLQQMGRDHFPLWGGSNLLPAKLVADNGLTALAVADFTWINQGSATAADQDGTILFQLPAGSGNNVRGMYRSAPSTPYSYVMAFEAIATKPSGQLLELGLALYETGTDKLVFICFFSGNDRANDLEVRRYTNVTTGHSTPIGPVGLIEGNRLVWLKVEDDGTDITFYQGLDGKNWVEIWTETRGNFFTSAPDAIAFVARNSQTSGHGCIMRICHWSREL